MEAYFTYFVPAIVVLVLVAATALIIYVNVAKSKLKTALRVERKPEQPLSIVVPSKEQLAGAFEAYQQGGDALLEWVRQNRRQHQPTDDRQQQSGEVPEENHVRRTEAE